MEKTINISIKQRRRKLFFVFLVIILSYHLVAIPFLFLYPPANNETVPRLLNIFYTKIQLKRETISSYIETSIVLSYLKNSEFARSMLSVITQCYFLFIPLVFYKKTNAKFYISKMITTGTADRRGILLFWIVLFSMILYVIICSAYFTPQKFPPFNMTYMIFWIRYIFVVCFLVPFGEELLFRGIVINEIKYCYNLSPCVTIFFQAMLFFLLHFLFSSGYPLVTLQIGIVMGIFAFYTNSLLYSTLYHICYNIFILLRQTGYINLAEYKISYFILIPLTFLFFLLYILFIILFINHMKTLAFSVKDHNAL
jgi:membrane protease YdiL (CAAX protease family)